MHQTTKNQDAYQGANLLRDLDLALDQCATKREVSERLCTSASALNSIIYKKPELARRWKRLPADGAFAGRFAGLPSAIHEKQHRLDDLVREACNDLEATGCPIHPDNAQSHDAIRLLLAMYAITGTMNFDRGWIRSVMIALTDACGAMPSAKVMRLSLIHISSPRDS